MPSTLSLLALLWLAWLLSWALASGWSASTVTRQSAGSRIAQSLPIWVGAVLLFRTATGILSARLFPAPPWMGWVTVPMAVLGFAVTWWARIHLGRFWSAAVTLKAGHTLIRSGPYAVTRHPIYSGLLLALVATAMAEDSVGGVIGVGLILLGLVLKLRQEEAFMSGQFGQAYADYKKNVPALIPRAW